MELLELLTDYFGTRSEAATALEISRSTLSGWLNERDRHPSNSSLLRILNLASKVNPERTRKILEDESNAFDKAIARFVRRGANKRTDET